MEGGSCSAEPWLGVWKSWLQLKENACTAFLSIGKETVAVLSGEDGEGSMWNVRGNNCETKPPAWCGLAWVRSNQATSPSIFSFMRFTETITQWFSSVSATNGISSCLYRSEQ